MADFGHAPYEESAVKAALRLLAAGARGAGAAIQGNLDPFSAFGQGFTRETQASDAAKQAAAAYAMKQQEAQRLQENSALDRQYKEALIEQLKKPPKPEKPPKLEPWEMPRDQQDAIIDYKRREAAALESVRPKGGKEKPDRAPILDWNTVMDNFRQEKDVQNFTVVRDNTRRINSALEQGTGFGDLSAIFAFMRVLDPNSVVRETEFKNAEEASGWLQRVLNLPGKAVQGNRLTPQARAKIKSMANSLSSTQTQTYNRTVARYKSMAKKFGVDPNTIITDYKDSDDPLGVR